MYEEMKKVSLEILYNICGASTCKIFLNRGIYQDTAKEIKKIANFLGVKRSDDEIDELVEATSFQSMKKEASKPMSQMSFFRKGISVYTIAIYVGLLLDKIEPFILHNCNVPLHSVGKVADWKNQLTVAQSELMDEKFNEKLSGIDIKFTYE